MAVKKEDVLAYLENANMMEVSELISDIEEKFGVSAAAPVAVAAAPAAGDYSQAVPAPALPWTRTSRDPPSPARAAAPAAGGPPASAPGTALPCASATHPQ